ncbi:MAG: hypothetical protein HQL64_13785 [Magnetococcales bacterium]|nr:hypothetical protein [Magnetococcales bacterium]
MTAIGSIQSGSALSGASPAIQEKTIVIGLGGVGIHAVSGIDTQAVETILAVDSDVSTLSRTPSGVTRLAIGLAQTRGLGTSGKISQGKEALEKDFSKIKELLDKHRISVALLCAGTGGGTGGGAALVMANQLRDAGVSLIVTLLIDPPGVEDVSERDQIWTENKHIFLSLSMDFVINKDIGDYFQKGTTEEWIDFPVKVANQILRKMQLFVHLKPGRLDLSFLRSDRESESKTVVGYDTLHPNKTNSPLKWLHISDLHIKSNGNFFGGRLWTILPAASRRWFPPGENRI